MQQLETISLVTGIISRSFHLFSMQGIQCLLTPLRTVRVLLLYLHHVSVFTLGILLQFGIHATSHSSG
jgi:hypothetical protein